MPVHLNESHILLFLIQMLLLLGLARALGILFQRYGLQAITAEILVGVFLGPTIFGRYLPGLERLIFPDDPTQKNMLETVAWLGVLFFLLQTGLETDLTAAWRQRKQALVISLTDLTLPMALAFIGCMFLPAKYLGDSQQRLLFALLIAAVMTISALPVAARLLQDLNIYRTDVGLLIMSALSINDVAGWVVFAVILGFATEGGMDLARVPVMVGATLLFATLFLTVGRYLTDRAIRIMHRWRLPEPGSSLTFIWLLGLLGGAITLKIGIHALFGFFIAGIMAGGSKALSENTRHVISQIVHAVLVPLFFVAVGLRVDFFSSFDVLLVLFILGIGVSGRFFGAWVGCILAKGPARSRHLIAVAHVPGGSMEVVVGMLALEYGVINDTVFVAIVCGAVVSSLIAGPWMRWALSRSPRLALLRFFSRDAIAADLKVTDMGKALEHLCGIAARHEGVGNADELLSAVLAREKTMSTALEDGVAVPHARMESVQRPLVVVARAREGIEWNSPDGKPTHFVFLILTPAGEDEPQLTILRGIASAMGLAQNRKVLEDARDEDQMWAALQEMLEPEREPEPQAAT